MALLSLFTKVIIVLWEGLEELGLPRKPFAPLDAVASLVQKLPIEAECIRESTHHPIFQQMQEERSQPTHFHGMPFCQFAPIVTLTQIVQMTVICTQQSISPSTLQSMQEE
jgi:hypothetical protein